MSTHYKFRLRLYRENEIAIGPGKVELLEAIADTGSISSAARRLGMSYRRAWLLVDAMNRSLREPAVATAAGGSHGGGARLTDTGLAVIRLYRDVEAAAEQAAREPLAALETLLAP